MIDRPLASLGPLGKLSRAAFLFSDRPWAKIPDDLAVRAQVEQAARRASAPAADYTAELEALFVPYAERRRAELALADMLDNAGWQALNANPSWAYDYGSLVSRMRACRQAGSWGIAGDGSARVLWDDKCGLTRLCPDEAREEAVRFAERYTPALEGWRAARKGRALHYSVLTWPNIARGALAEMKRAMATSVRAWLKLPELEGVAGAVCAQEDPLSASGEWHIHTNLILAVEGRFVWGDARRAWYRLTRKLFPQSQSDFQVHFSRIRNARTAVAELLKYSVKHVTGGGGSGMGQGKIAAPRASGAAESAQKAAPGLADWPPDAFAEWWTAGLRFRRSRSYGCLYRVKTPEKAEKAETDQTRWLGRVQWQSGFYGLIVRSGASSSISLIQANNFSRGGGARGKSAGLDGARAGPRGSPMRLQ